MSAYLNGKKVGIAYASNPNLDTLRDSVANAFTGKVNGRDAVRLDGVSSLPHTPNFTITPYNYINQEEFFASNGIYEITPVVEVGKRYTLNFVFAETVANTSGKIAFYEHSMSNDDDLVEHVIISLGEVYTTSVTFEVKDGYEYFIDSSKINEFTVAFESVSLIREKAGESVYKYGKNLYDYPGNKGDVETIDIGVIDKPSTLSFTANGTASGTIQLKRNIDEVWTRVAYIASSGELRVPTFTIDGVTNAFGEYQITTSNNTGTGYLATVQLELGLSATEYEKYKAPTLVTDGYWYTPTTTVISDVDGVDIAVEYNRDSNTVYQELVNAIRKLGGTV